MQYRLGPRRVTRYERVKPAQTSCTKSNARVPSRANLMSYRPVVQIVARCSGPADSTRSVDHLYSDATGSKVVANGVEPQKPGSQLLKNRSHRPSTCDFQPPRLASPELNGTRLAHAREKSKPPAGIEPATCCLENNFERRFSRSCKSRRAQHYFHPSRVGRRPMTTDYESGGCASAGVHDVLLLEKPSVSRPVLSTVSTGVHRPGCQRGCQLRADPDA
jgi:hypothetical protein